MHWYQHLPEKFWLSLLGSFSKKETKELKRFGYFLIIFLLSTAISAQDLRNIRKLDPVKVSGSFSATLNNNGSSDPMQSFPPFVYYLSGNVNLSVYGMSFPFSYTYSQRNSSATNPFYRIGVSPEYKWATLHLGYRSVRFSKFTLGGHNFLGAGLELNPGILRVGGVYGRFSKKILPTIENPLDTIAGYTRKGYALKLGVGKKHNFFDVLFMRIRDDANSLEDQYIEQSKAPEANSVLGVHSKLNFAKKIAFETEAAISAYTDDIFATEIEEDDSDNTTFQKLAKKFDVNQSSYYAIAIASQVQYIEDNFSIGASYRRIDPGYRSMGAYYFPGDLENITLDTRFKLFNRKLSLRGSIGIQNNNLNENKKSTTNKLISKINFTFKPSQKFGVAGNFTNFSIDQKPGRLPLNDTIKLYRVNNNISLSPYLLFVSGGGSSTLSLNVSSSNLTDNNPITSAFSEVNSKTAFLNFSRNQKTYALNYSLGLSYNSMKTFGLDQDAIGLNASVGKSLIGNKLRLGLSGAISKNNRNDDSGLVTRAGLTSTYRIQKKHMFQLRFHYTDVSYPEGSVARSYHRHRSTVRYILKF